MLTKSIQSLAKQLKVAEQWFKISIELEKF